jgi:hypothetical protein
MRSKAEHIFDSNRSDHSMSSSNSDIEAFGTVRVARVALLNQFSSQINKRIISA